MLNNIKSNEIGSNKNLNNSFLSATHNELDYSCNIYQGTFLVNCTVTALVPQFLFMLL